MKMKSVKLSNPRTGEVWICEKFDQHRVVDGTVFIEVHRPDNQRAVWMNIESLVKIKDTKRTNR